MNMPPVMRQSLANLILRLKKKNELVVRLYIKFQLLENGTRTKTEGHLKNFLLLSLFSMDDV